MPFPETERLTVTTTPQDVRAAYAGLPPNTEHHLVVYNESDCVAIQFADAVARPGPGDAAIPIGPLCAGDVVVDPAPSALRTWFWHEAETDDPVTLTIGVEP